MGVLERTKHAVRADLNDLIRKARDPEAVLEAYLEDLTAVQAEAQSLRSVEAAERDGYEARLRDIQSAMDVLEEKASLCLERDDEELARAALDRRFTQQEELEELSRELTFREASLQVLDDSLETLRLRIAEVNRKRRELRFRRQAISARSELQQAMSRLGAERDEPLLAQADEGVAAIESQLEAAEQMQEEDLETRARQLEASEHRRRRQRDVDEHLERLRKQLRERKG